MRVAYLLLFATLLLLHDVDVEDAARDEVVLHHLGDFVLAAPIEEAFLAEEVEDQHDDNCDKYRHYYNASEQASLFTASTIATAFTACFGGDLI